MGCEYKADFNESSQSKMITFLEYTSVFPPMAANNVTHFTAHQGKCETGAQLPERKKKKAREAHLFVSQATAS